MTQQTQNQNQPLPRQFGKYVLVRKIAMGGMAEIFKAKTAGAEGFEKDVVIKRILPHFTEDESFVKMFIDEAAITSKLQHANIVQIFDFDVCEGSYYIAMELIEGVDLKKVIDVGIKTGKPLSIAQTVWIMMELSKGLHYAHTKEYKGQPLNIVHRDISPHNAMVSYNGEVKLMDFGIAKAAQRSTKTMAGTVKGKVAYMSPEQARGKNLDGRSDLFALGIMLWEMLTAKRLFLGDSDFETLTNVLKNNPPPPSTINPKVPKDLDEIVLKALMKDRDERYPSVEAFARDLTRWYYSNVADLEAESLKKFMHEVFADEIEKLRVLNDEEKGLPAAAASGGGGGGGGGAMAQSERTVAMPADASFEPAAPPPRRAGTNSGMAAAAGGGPGGFAQQPQMTAMTGAYGTGVQPERPRSKAWLWILLVLLLGGGAAAAIILTQGGSSTQPPQAGGGEKPAPETPKETGEIVLQVEPRAAKVTVDGKPAGDKVSGLEMGSAVPVKVEAEGYVTYEDIIQVEKKSNILKIKLEKTRAKVPLVIEATGDPEAVIRVNGKSIGTGSGMYEGLEGDTIEIEVQPSAPDAKPIKETAVLDGTTKLKKIAAAKSGAKVILKIEPAGAEVKVSKGKVTMTAANDGALIEDLSLNDTVEVTVSKGAEYSVWKENVALLKESQELNVKLTKKAIVAPEKVDPGTTPGPGPGPGPTPNPVGGSGKLTILARPWAKVSVGGKPYGNAPTTIDMKAGSYSVKCSKGAIEKTVSVKVVAGQTATAQCGDMQ